METRAEHTIEKYHMIPKGSTVIIGLSGGADSVALAHFLYLRRQALGFTLAAAHLNHGLRGEEAARDEAFVADLCRGWQIPLHIRHADVKKEIGQSGEGEEECGRRLRYAFFNQLAVEAYPGALIATAHTLNDTMETILFHMVRGTGLQGLCGIPPVRGRIIRPLIDCTRAEIEAYCERFGLSYVTDSTNAERCYARNRLRLDVLPQFMQMNPSLPQAMRRMVASLREDNDYLRELAQGAYANARCGSGLRSEALKSLAEPVLNRVIQAAVKEQTGSAADYESVGRIKRALSTGESTQIFGGYDVRLRKGVLEFVCKAEKRADFERTLSVGENELPFGVVFVQPYEEFENIFKKINKNLLTNCIDCDRIRGKMIIRNRRNGDSYRIRQRGCTKSLKKLFNEAGVPPEKRADIPVVCDEDGILWVHGFGAAERCAVSEGTKRFLALDFQPKQEESAFCNKA